MLVQSSVSWHHTFIFYENHSIHLEYARQFGVNMFCAECSCSNKGALIRPLRGNMPTQAALHLEKWTVWNDIGTPWGRRRTVRGSEQVIRSALLHVKWDTVTSSPPPFLLSPEEKLYKGSQQRVAGQVFEGTCSVSSSLYKYPCFSHLFLLFLTMANCPSLSQVLY